MCVYASSWLHSVCLLQFECVLTVIPQVIMDALGAVDQIQALKYTHTHVRACTNLIPFSTLQCCATVMSIIRLLTFGPIIKKKKKKSE